MVLDVKDFITEQGGNPEKIRESQRRRFDSVEIVDEIIEQWQVQRKSEYKSAPHDHWLNLSQPTMPRPG